ncbi:iron-sulfur cluster assembly protein CIA2 [Aspergillus homomorphus CBS 101889]|uniref:MIP18 family-like domain-containing protein n=1 Tax=Aspergillus homomorphus (strain CBS 101889) TaxID=1450537 RepID=A0A395HHT4_ASPHC|nr:hypothetical protein BO97DRAFT_473643 [Aspergillus homomorphus CBS 101889]RAL07482.1 hypothetical protein BO97DRAFT_473643 [Aspergillus homomorphus CBS 101889]
MASAVQNSNPTILNVADLPTRLGPAALSKAGTDRVGTLASIFPPSAYSLDCWPTGYSSSDASDEEDVTEEPIDEQEIYDLISSISDPEHPISLGALAVVSLPDIAIKPTLPEVPESVLRTVSVLITPTITHCSLATVIGLGVRVRLEQSLPPRFRVDVRIKEGSHSTAEEVNKQLADKERVAAALENGTLMGVIAKMLETCQ